MPRASRVVTVTTNRSGLATVCGLRIPLEADTAANRLSPNPPSMPSQ
jgi:hypothetical protein